MPKVTELIALAAGFLVIAFAVRAYGKATATPAVPASLQQWVYGNGSPDAARAYNTAGGANVTVPAVVLDPLWNNQEAGLVVGTSVGPGF